MLVPPKSGPSPSVHFEIPESAENATTDKAAASITGRHHLDLPQLDFPDLHFLTMMNHQDSRFSRWMSRTLQRTVLKPDYYLRRQLFLSFGTTSFFAISFFIVIGILTAQLSGQSVIGEARKVQEELARYTLSSSARFVSETLTKKIQNLQTASDILKEVARDRIVGYKLPEFLMDETTDWKVPFQDHYTGNNVYPLNTPDLMTLDWNITTNLANSEEAKLHLQGREQWYHPDQQVNTGYGAYFMQGACDPEAAPGDLGYYPDCSEKNNNLRDGGVVAPSDTNYYLSQKA
jgi:hypothetical protein